MAGKAVSWASIPQVIICVKWQIGRGRNSQMQDSDLCGLQEVVEIDILLSAANLRSYLCSVFWTSSEIDIGGEEIPKSELTMICYLGFYHFLFPLPV